MRLAPRELRQRAEAARAQYRRCLLCGHRCAVDRTSGPAGVCREGDGLFLGGAGVHFGEEPPLVGPLPRAGAPRPARSGSGLVLVGGCNLACSSCETADLSLERRGLVAVDEGGLAALLLDLQAKGAANINFVTPTHVAPALLAGLARAADRGFALPVVWNCGGYETREALELLEGVVDIYLPDAKFGTAAQGRLLSGCADYPAALRESLAEMHRQVGPLALGEDGLAVRGVLVRHLVLPGGAAAPEELMRLVAGVSRELWMNVMSQYRPLHEARRFPVIARRPRPEEVQGALDAARAAGLVHLLLDGRPA